jgi:hypothetical protein
MSPDSTREVLLQHGRAAPGIGAATMNLTSLDILSNRWLAATVFCLPIAIIALSGNFDIGNQARGVVWAACLGIMATGCLANARRCGRVHCYFTGPFLLLMALASLSYGFGWLPLGGGKWNFIAGITLGGAVILGCVPELLFGKYRRR